MVTGVLPQSVGASKKKKDPGMPEGVNPTFTVTPEEIELRPRTAVTFTFRGFSAKKGSVQEKLVCESREIGRASCRERV